MRTVGIDSATHTGLALVGDGEDRGRVIEIKGMKGFGRLQLIAAEFDRTISIWSPDLVVMEAYAFYRNVDSFVCLVECGTVIKQVLSRRKIPWLTVSPTSLKKWTTGSGNASKEDMAKAAAERWGVNSPSHDIVDAFALAHMGQMDLGKLLQIPGVARQH